MTVDAARRDTQAGLTLVEMLVALVLFGLVGLASFAMLDTVIRARDRTEGRLETVAAIDRALRMFSQDLAQSQTNDRTLTGGQLGFRALTPEGGAALRYHLQDGFLLRSLDRANAAVSLDQRVLGGVLTAEWRVLDASNVWHDEWPLPEGSENRLVAVQMDLSLEGPTALTVHRLIEIPVEP